jgi:hypothetical protein
MLAKYGELEFTQDIELLLGGKIKRIFFYSNGTLNDNKES